MSKSLDQIMADMKAQGITISYKPSPVESDGLGRRAMETLHSKAQELGMTYGEEEGDPSVRAD